MADVFISYKQEEREAISIIATSLADLKLDVWFDSKLRAGGSFDAEIATALEMAKAVLVCWTPAAIRSEWVRAEATEGRNGDRLVACFLQPTALPPPFNLTHAENLSAWAGQHDDSAWLKLLDRIGELVGRPGLSGYYAVMRPGASTQELREWANVNGADPLIDTVWTRIGLVEGEGADARLAREKAEARTAAEQRKAQAEKSRRLARERGLRDPVRERRRFLVLAGSGAAIAILLIGAIWYVADGQERERVLRDEVTTTQEARTFLADRTLGGWHPIAALARDKFERLDEEAWRIARRDGSIDKLQAYIADADQTLRGKALEQARTMLAAAQNILSVQPKLKRMGLHRGPINGAHDQATQDAIALFRYRWNIPVSTGLDEPLKQKLDEALDWWIHPRLEELHTRSTDPPAEAEFIRLAKELGLDAATILALLEVETVDAGFLPDGRPKILFEAHLFSRLTGGRWDASHPDISGNQVRYGPAGAHQYERLQDAYALDREAALKATSWGRLQILGQNYKMSGHETVGEFVRFMAQSEASQIEAGLLGFVHTQRLDDALRNHQWEAFARRYNGPANVAQYSRRLKEAYDRLSARIAATHAPAGAGEIPTAAIPPTTPDRN